MLTEHFVASTAAHTKPNTGVTKDAGIFFHEYQPLAAQRHIFKKSATARNCLAVSASHIFAAQAEKAVVHVYNREKGNQEAVIPFPERIHSIVLAVGDTVLLLGTESGRILLWETCTGRLVSTTTSHLQRVTSLAVDPSSNYFLSGSSDSIIHVWSLQSVLSFAPDTSRSPVHTLSTHRGPINALVTGQIASSTSIAVSAAQDKSAIVWDYKSGRALRTYLLEAEPLSLVLDPAERALYASYEDGSLQIIDFFDETHAVTPVDDLRNPEVSNRVIQPPSKTRFDATSQNLGNALSLALSWDSTVLLSGHASGKIASWDIAKGTYTSTLAILPGPVTNINFLLPIGFPNAPSPNFKIPTVVKPKHDTASALGDGNGIVPVNYTMAVQFTKQLNIPRTSASEVAKAEKSDFEIALTHPSFPTSMLEEAIAEVGTWNPQANKTSSSADFLSLAQSDVPADSISSDEVKELKKQLASLQRVQKVTFGQLAELREERQWFIKKEEQRERRQRKRRRLNKEGVNGTGRTEDGDVEMSEGSEESSDEEENEEEEESAGSMEDEDQESPAEDDEDEEESSSEEENEQG